ncbi:MAG TPA: TerC/Alx family metal homeostasis membrane protein [Kofleriaceae bacterium]|nr:TerC/Alx family metal homeostasis membrane protein [Kofleriaceae bacterium]
MAEPTLKSALARTGFWIALAVLFGLGVTAHLGTQRGMEFFTGYLLEQALSVDNLFVMMLVFARFQVPKAAQRRVLTWGIAGVVLLRGVMIFGGTALVGTFHALTYVLGAVLLYSAYKLARDLGDDDHGAGDDDSTASIGMRVRRVVGRLIPISDSFAGDRFTVVLRGIRHATPLLLALVTIEIADAIFALDSIPAVFGVTTDRFIVFSSNLFAVLGLRSMYFALSGLFERLRFLQHGLVGVLGFIGLKMLVAAVWTVPAWFALAAVALILGGAIAASLLIPQKELNAEQS